MTGVALGFGSKIFKCVLKYHYNNQFKKHEEANQC